MEKGLVTYNCPKCGDGVLAEWPQTVVHDKKKKTEAILNACQKCRAFFVITTKVVNIREVDASKWDGRRKTKFTEITPEDLNY